MATTAPNQRASLLSGLRTGGVRSASVNVPHTAAPGASFNISRFSSSSYANNNAIGEEEDDQLADMVAQKMYFNNAPPRMQQPPMTAAVDGSFNRFVQQQQNMHSAMPNGGASHMHAHTHAQAQQQQALQMQMMQLEMLRLQAMQAQQYQAELLAQAQLQQQHSRGFHPPATAGPMNTSFGAAQLRRPSQAEALRHQLGLAHDEQVPMTAALGGKFGGRLQIPEDDFPGTRYQQQQQTPMTPTYTNVISGGTSLGGSGHAARTNAAPSKSDSAVSWRSASTNHSVLRRSPPPATPDVKVTPPPIDTAAPALPQNVLSPATATTATPGRARPSPLRFAPAAQLTAVAIDESTDGEDAGSESSSNKSGGSLSGSSPATPQSGASFGAPPLSPREEASKKLYEGLGLGRPVPAAADKYALPPQTPAALAPTSQARTQGSSQALRQPRGPPSGQDELARGNFAARIRKRAIGGLLDARERREPIEAF